MPAELSRNERRVGGDVHHARVEVPEQAVAAVPQRRPHPGRLDPPLDPRPGPLVLQVPGHRAELDAEAPETAGHLRQRAGAAVGQPRAGVEGLVVHRLGGLQVQQEHRRARTLRDRCQHAWRQVGGEEADDQVAARHPQFLGRRRSFGRVRDEARVHDLAVQFGQPGRHPARGSFQLGQQRRELRPVRAEPAGDEADAGAARGDAIHGHRSSVSAGTRPPPPRRRGRAARWCGSGRRR